MVWGLYLWLVIQLFNDRSVHLIWRDNVTWLFIWYEGSTFDWWYNCLLAEVSIWFDETMLHEYSYGMRALPLIGDTAVYWRKCPFDLTRQCYMNINMVWGLYLWLVIQLFTGGSVHLIWRDNVTWLFIWYEGSTFDWWYICFLTEVSIWFDETMLHEYSYGMRALPLIGDTAVFWRKCPFDLMRQCYMIIHMIWGLYFWLVIQLFTDGSVHLIWRDNVTWIFIWYEGSTFDWWYNCLLTEVSIWFDETMLHEYSYGMRALPLIGDTTVYWRKCPFDLTRQCYMNIHMVWGLYLWLVIQLFTGGSVHLIWRDNVTWILIWYEGSTFDWWYNCLLTEESIWFDETMLYDYSYGRGLLWWLFYYSKLYI